MMICRIDGNAIATIHHPTLRGWTQLICQPLDETGKAVGKPILCMDRLGAGLHETVLVTSDGISIRKAVGTEYTPLRYMTIAIIDAVTAEKAS